jgi:cytoskeletal protein CcmA (bactofilin family)
MPFPRSVVMCIVTVALAATGTVRAQPPVASGIPSHADNYYAAGNHIEIASAMPADVIVAGRQVDIAQPVAGDILAAGWRVTLSGHADDDVRIAGGEVIVDAPVAGDLTAAGGDVTIGPLTRVGGRSWLTGRNVRVAGHFDRDLQIAGATVEIAGEIRQPLRVIAEKLEILPSARILGPLTYQGSSEMHVAEGAVINGPVTYDRIPQQEAQRARAFPTLSSLLFVTHLLLAGLLVVIFLPGVETSVVAALRAQPGKSLLAGFAFLVSMPVAAVLLVVSVLGIPIGLALGALYIVALFGAVLATAFFVGDAEVRFFRAGPIATKGQHAVLLFAGVITLAFLRAVLGGVIVFASVLFGLGALMLAAYRTYASWPATAAA